MAETDLQGLSIDKRQAAGAASHRHWLRRIVGICLLVAGGTAAAVIFLTRPIEVETTTVALVYPSSGITLLNAGGYVVAQRKAALAAQTTGRLEWLGVEEGSRVTTGQVLARLENREAAAILDQTRARHAAAQAELRAAEAEERDAAIADQRLQHLLTQGVIAPSEADTATARRERAEATVVAARARIAVAAADLRAAQVAYDNTFIRAPFDAVVLTKNADLGDIVTPLGAAANAKSAVVSIADLSSLQVEADVAEASLGLIRPGQPCEIVLDAIPDSRFRGELVTIVPTADRSKATVMVKIRFNTLDPRILPEMSARVAILSQALRTDQETPRTAVPAAAIRTGDDGPVVFRVVDNQVRVTPVVTGEQIGDQVTIVSGVSAGSKIVLRPLDRLRENRRIREMAP